jgi:hypothetical protein
MVMTEDELDDLIGLAVRDTANEIFAYAMGEDEDEAEYNEQLVDAGSQAEGWDGQSLGIEEIAARTIYGDHDNNFDRPLEMAEEIAGGALIRQMQETIVAQNNYIDEHIDGPQRQAAHAAHRDQVREHLYARYGLAAIDDAQLDRFITDTQGAAAQTERLQDARVNASMTAAHGRYGRDFEDAFNDITSMDTSHPFARSIVQHVVGSADPGEAVMNWHDNATVQGLGAGRPPPFLAPSSGRYQQPASPRRSRPEADDGAGWGDRAIEADVFASAFDDEY